MFLHLSIRAEVCMGGKQFALLSAQDVLLLVDHLLEAIDKQ